MRGSSGMKVLLWLGLLVSVFNGIAQSQRKPNIILILADDLGYGDLSSYGQKQWQTPNIDRLAREGAKLTNFYTPTPYCAPTRASLLTGLYPIRHGLTSNPNPEKVNNSFQTYRGGDDLGIGSDQLLLSEVLSQAGYATKIVGKWHLGHKPEYYPRRHGFDEYYGIPYSNDMRPVVLMNNDSIIEYPVVQASLTQRYTQQALAFIENHKDQPFFLYLPHAMPHKPLVASERFYTPATKDDLYGDAMRELDWSIGQVLDRLSSLNLDKNTIVVFLSDNGPWFGGSSGDLRGMKSQNWEGGIRVPFLIRWPQRIPAAHVTGEIAGVIDVFPTLLSLAGLPLPAKQTLDGIDISSVLTSNAPSPHDALFSFYNASLQTVRKGKWKLHINAPESSTLPNTADWIDPRSPDGVTILAPFEQPRATQFPGINTGDASLPGLLFDLEADPTEQHSVADKHPEVVKSLTLIANQYLSKYQKAK